MSTYNGEQYLREQIDSIIQQQEVNISLIVRDDGSTDLTKSILEEYQRAGQLSYYSGENLGPQKSFYELIKQAPTSDYYALADQDDIWLPIKLKTAVAKLTEYQEEPALYCSSTRLTDNNLQSIRQLDIHPMLSFGESLVYAYASGCTMVFNDALRKDVVSYQPKYMDMHDRWIINIAFAIGGKVIYDKQSLILYRQHDHNAVGLHDSEWKKWKQRFLRIWNHQQKRSLSAIELYKGFQHRITPENKDILLLFIEGKKSMSKRIRLLFDNRFKCGDKKTWLLFKWAVMLNTY